ncbi:MAG: hypothetical protein IJK22_04365 [Bacteroidales bacterium]|nr:hypothetical protein [Bacteroidales bacterium]
MALTGTLVIENKEYIILECEYEFTQAVDHTGRPTDRTRGGLINVVIAAPGNDNLVLHEWMRDKDAVKDGTINLTINSDNVDKPKTIQFKDAYCVRLYEYFNSNNSVQMYLKLSIMAGTVIFGDDCEFTLIDK